MSVKSKPNGTIRDLKPDARNANKGTERGVGMLEYSLREYGAGRSLLVDRNGVVIAGNKTLEAAASIGLDDVIVVESDGNKLVVVRRTDLDMESDPRARALAVADNRVAQVGLAWDTEVLQELVASDVDLSRMFTGDELARLVEKTSSVEVAPDVEQWMIIVTCSGEAQQRSLLDRFVAEGLSCRALVS